jgi:hypothetical protein
MFYAQLGDVDQAIVWLEKAYKENDGSLYLLKVHPFLDPIRDDPRYHDLVRRMNYPDIDTRE